MDGRADFGERHSEGFDRLRRWERHEPAPAVAEREDAEDDPGTSVGLRRPPGPELGGRRGISRSSRDTESCSTPRSGSAARRQSFFSRGPIGDDRRAPSASVTSSSRSRAAPSSRPSESRGRSSRRRGSTSTMGAASTRTSEGRTSPPASSSGSSPGSRQSASRTSSTSDFEIDEFYRRGLQSEKISAADALAIQSAAWRAVEKTRS